MPPTAPLPDISSLYQRYKADNLRIANWLGRTAIKTGFSSSNLSIDPDYAAEREGKAPSLNDQRTAKQLRNARKKAKQRQTRKQGRRAAGAECHGSKDQEDDTPFERVEGRKKGAQRYVITVNEYLAKTAHLVANNVHIPIFIIRLISRCIRLRKQCQEAYPRGFGVSDCGHAYFISAMEEIHARLEALRDTQLASGLPTEAGRARTGTEDAPQLRNRYAAFLQDGGDLEEEEDSVEEDFASLSDSAAGSGCDSDSHSDSNVRFATESALDALKSDLSMFINEVGEIRDYLCALWHECKEGKLSLVTASATAHMATAMLSTKYGLLLDQGKALGRSLMSIYETFISRVQPVHSRTVNGETIVVPCIGCSQHSADGALFHRQIQVIRNLCKSHKGNNAEACQALMQELVNGFPGTSDNSRPLAQIEGRLIDDFYITAWQYLIRLPEVDKLGHFADLGPEANDATLRAIAKTVRDPEFVLLATVAVQISHDAVTILIDTEVASQVETVQVLENLVTDLRECEWSITRFDSDNLDWQQALTGYAYVILYMIQNLDVEYWESRMEGYGTARFMQSSRRCFTFSPMWLGKLQEFGLAMVRTVALQMLSPRSPICHFAHLYLALQQTADTSSQHTQWSDMQRLVSSTGWGNVFSADIEPDGSVDIARIERSLLEKLRVQDRDISRHLGERVARSARKRGSRTYVTQVNVDNDTSSLLAHLERRLWNVEAHQEVVAYLTTLALECCKAAPKDLRQRDISRAIRGGHPAPVVLLQIMVLALEAELPKLYFNCLGMISQGYDFAVGINLVQRAHMEQYGTATRWEFNSPIVPLIRHLSTYGVSPPRSAPSSRATTDDFKATADLLASAKAIIDEHVRTKGDQQTQRMSRNGAIDNDKHAVPVDTNLVALILSSHPDCEKRDPRCPGNNNWRDVKQLVKEAQGRLRIDAVGF